MGRFDDSQGTFEVSAEELVAKAFSRCSNYPDTRIGVVGLAEALSGASLRFSVPMEAILRSCVECSTYCPTDHDILNVGRDLHLARKAADESRRDKTAEWRKQYGAPTAVPWTAEDRERTMAVKTRHRKMWREIREEFGMKADKSVYLGWAACAAAARKLGYPDYAEAWERAISHGN